jgi:hypothetical protein
MKGNACTNEFFAVIKEKPKALIVIKLRDNHGQITREKREMEIICMNFYSTLYDE